MLLNISHTHQINNLYNTLQLDSPCNTLCNNSSSLNSFNLLHQFKEARYLELINNEIQKTIDDLFYLFIKIADMIIYEIDLFYLN